MTVETFIQVGNVEYILGEALLVRFWSRIDKSVDGCWEWLGHRNAYGYGQVNVYKYPMGVTVPAHRVSYTLLVGPIEAGLQLDHLCRNRGCVNPSHLEPVTQSENMKRRWAFERLCKKSNDL